MSEREHSRIQESRRRRGPIRLGALLGFSVWAMAAAVWLIGADETITIGQGNAPTVAADHRDESIVAWESSDREVVVQSLRMGITLGVPFRVSSVDAAQQNAAAAHLTANEFAVAWEEEGDTGTGIMARRIRVVPSMGITLGVPIRIAEVGTSPAVDADDKGNFVVAWTAPDPSSSFHGSSSDSHRHFLVALSRMGITLGVPIQLGAASGPTPPDVARRPDGDSLVVWEDASADIRGAVVDAFGDVVNDRIRINQSRLGRQSSPAVTVPLDGNYTVIWEREVLKLRFLVGRRLGVDGEGIGDEFPVSLSLSTIPTEPDVASDGWGRGYVTWTSRRPFHGAKAILGRQLDLDGAVGPESVLAGSNAVVSSVDQSDSIEDFFVAWESDGAGGPVISGGFVLVPVP